jgi:hypothetical protein
LLYRGLACGLRAVRGLGLRKSVLDIGAGAKLIKPKSSVIEHGPSALKPSRNLLHRFGTSRHRIRASRCLKAITISRD